MVDRNSPKRTLNKQEATRHLIHSSIRMFMSEEDPFSIHALIHSADKLLIDVSRKTQKALEFDWDAYVRKDMQNEFFKLHRETYNYFKHADSDWEDQLPVYEIVPLNAISLFICILNYRAIYKENTSHMNFFLVFFNLVSPGKVRMTEEANVAHKLAREVIGSETPRSMFGAVVLHPEYFDAAALAAERAQDCSDNGDYFTTTFEDHQDRGGTKNDSN